MITFEEGDKSPYLVFHKGQLECKVGFCYNENIITGL